MAQVILMTLFVFLLFGEVVSLVVNNKTGQDSGTFLGFGDLFKEDLEYLQIANDNDGTQRTGTSLFFRGGSNGNLRSSSLSVENDAQNNIATSDTDSTSSGAVSVFNNILQDSDVYLDTDSTGNKVYIDKENTQDGSGSASAVSGVDEQAKYVANSDFTSTANAENNLADNNYNGKSIAGIQRSFGTTKNSLTSLNATSSDNEANNDNGIAIAGIQTNMFESINTANTLNNVATNNNATSYNGPAVSGITFNAGTIMNDGTGQRSGDAVTTTDTSADNTATAYNGKAISGIQWNVDSAKNADFYFSGDSQNNNATAYDNSYGTGVDQNVVAGTQLNVNEVVNSGTGGGAGSGTDNVNNGNGFGGFQVDVYSKDNSAINKQNGGGNAIAGNQVNIGSAMNSKLYFDMESVDNYAYSATGDAIAGNDLNIGSVTNTPITQNLQSSGATALAPNGRAIIDTATNINYN
eukprot:TRINITY_DN789_c0_g1_i16.p1 TRINITY_DN789_c0_g1~~TRINITY_DN789_c0_g1_i16.p1  ORF type:complete len:465 (-),score=95.39 TRINITY_DN789_c0_g1_i16:1974-3368(-)